MTDQLALLDAAAARLERASAEADRVRAERDQAILAAIDANHWQNIVADHAGVSAQYVSKLKKQRTQSTEVDASVAPSRDWTAWYTKNVDEDAPLQDWHRYPDVVSDTDLRDILEQVAGLRPQDKTWLTSTRRNAPAPS